MRKRVLLSKNELGDVKYINYSYWNELSGGTRLVKDGVAAVLGGKIVYDQSNEGYLKAAEAVRGGHVFSTPILVTKGENSDLVILEGHLRLTAFYMALDSLPEELEFIVGTSNNMGNWNLY